MEIDRISISFSINQTQKDDQQFSHYFIFCPTLQLNTAGLRLHIVIDLVAFLARPALNGLRVSLVGFVGCIIYASLKVFTLSHAYAVALAMCLFSCNSDTSVYEV